MKRKIIIVTTIVILVLMVPVVYYGLLFLGMGGLSSIVYNAKYSVVFISGNSNLCEKLYSEDEDVVETWSSRYSCYKDLAISKNDARICEKIPKRDNLTKIKYRCYHDIAIKNNDLALCEKAESGHCYGVIGGETGDPNLCANLKENRMIVDCYFYLWYMMEYPDTGEHIGRINSNCEKIVDTKKRELCTDMFRVRRSSKDMEDVIESYN